MISLLGGRSTWWAGAGWAVGLFRSRHRHATFGRAASSGPCCPAPDGEAQSGRRQFMLWCYVDEFRGGPPASCSSWFMYNMHGAVNGRRSASRRRVVRTPAAERMVRDWLYDRGNFGGTTNGGVGLHFAARIRPSRRERTGLYRQRPSAAR